MASRKVLMFTNSEFGQANVFLATSHELLERDPDIEIHIASFAKLEKTALSALESAKDGKHTTPTFHTLPGRPMFQCLREEPNPRFGMFSVALRKPGLSTSPDTARSLMTRTMLCWTPEEYAALFAECCKLIKDLEPNVILVDNLHSPGQTAAKHMKSSVPQPYKIVLLSPNSIKDFCCSFESKGAIFWKYPVVGSGLPMPIPWQLVPMNIYLMIRLIGIILTDTHSSTLTAKVRELTGLPELELSTAFTLLNDQLAGYDKVLIGNRLEIDFPALNLTNVPKHYLEKIVGCGPILRACLPVEEELMQWLERGPVVYINLGTHCMTTEAEAVDMARCLRRLLDEAALKKDEKLQLQVLWKIQKDLVRDSDFSIGPGSAIHQVLGKELDADQIRIVDWISSEPNSILNTGHVVCAISHGGANSFSEAISAGVPQVVLPSWIDCYDYANRAELLGVGRWGSKKGCPRWKVSELGPILIDVVLDRYTEYKARCKELAEICQQNGGGRAVAAEEILNMIKS